MKLNFGQDAIVLPGGVLSCCEHADAAQMRALLWLASDLTLAEKPRQLAKLVGCTEKEIKGSVAFWVKQGVLVKAGEEPICEKKTEKKEEKTRRTLVQRADTLPTYTTTELAELLERRAGVRELVDEAQQIVGKMFNTAEVNILVGMLDYLEMEADCVLLLLAHCKRIGKTNLRAVEKYAYSLVDAGITDSEALEARIRQLEQLHTFEGEIRALFGLNNRALTSKEHKMMEAWASFGYGIDIVRRAYEITISSTNTPSIPYTNAILTRWSSEGWKTAEEIDARLAEETAQKSGTTLGNSFDTDEFFEAAVNRSVDKNGMQI